MREIARRLDVALSSVSIWVRDVAPTAPATPVDAAEPPQDWTQGPRRRCSRCKEHLPMTCFNRSGEGHQHWCRECFRAYFRARDTVHRAQVQEGIERRRAAAREVVLDVLRAGACKDCGEDEIVVLDFDHYLGEKDEAISQLVHQGAALPRLRRELARCELVCANCHRRRTARRALSYRLTGEPPVGWTTGQRRNQQYVLEFLRQSGCVDCGERDPVVLEFDHVGIKRQNVSRLASWGCSQRVLEHEISQCAVRCINCHRLRTLADGSWREPHPWIA